MHHESFCEEFQGQSVKSPADTEFVQDPNDFPTNIVSLQEVMQMSALEKSNYLLALHSEILTISSME
jgi:hypothetical protein